MDISKYMLAKFAQGEHFATQVSKNRSAKTVSACVVRNTINYLVAHYSMSISMF